MSSNHVLTRDGRRTLLHKVNSMLSRDFCPGANRYVYWLKNPFWILVLATGGSIACGVFLNPLVFVLTALLTVVTIAGFILPWVSVLGIECHVSFDVRRTRVGIPATVRLVVRNRLPFPVWGLSLIRGFALDTNADGDEGIALPRVPGWSSMEYLWAFEPLQRGVFPNDRAEVETGFPFGIYRAHRPVSINGQLIVWPQTVRLDGMPDAAELDHSEEQCSERRTGDFGDVMGTRPFRNGDSLRRVHWSQTARQQSLIVTERQAPAMTSVCLAVDNATASYSSDQSLDLCVQVAASVCESLHRQHARVELRLGDEFHVVGEGAASFHRAMDALATASAVSTAPPKRPSQGFEIQVTTPAGVAEGMPRQIVVGLDGEVTQSWIDLDVRDVAMSRFPDLWRRACHVS